MKIGTVIYEPTIVDGFDISVYYSKRVDGVLGKPAKSMYNDITCFVDAKSIRERPELVALSENGPAKRTNKAYTLPWILCAPQTKNTDPKFSASSKTRQRRTWRE